jgi:hypothetical protein
MPVVSIKEYTNDLPTEISVLHDRKDHFGWGRRPPFMDLIFENHKHDYGSLWGVFAAPNSLFTRGIGKSVLAIRMLYHAYGTWDEAKRYIFYTPKEFVKVFKELYEKKKRVPLIVWDDAGEWLYRGRFREKFAMTVVEYLEVIRTVVSNLMFTATSPGKLLKGVRESIRYVILVSSKGVIYIDKQRDKFIKRSLATLYVNQEDMTWLFNRRLKPPEPVMEYLFYVTLPEQVYREYNEYRMKYVGIALKKTQRELEALAEEAAEELEEIAQSVEKRDLEEIKNEEIEEEVEDLEEFREKFGY